jgi:hypothetical protein
MKKEGFDNLRDYLNYKQGKERRKAAPTKTASVPRDLLVVPKMKVMLVKLRLVQLKKLK